MTLRTEEDRLAIRHRRVWRITQRYWTRIAINVFVCWHLFALAIWLMPGQSSIAQSLGNVVRPYMTLTGFMQGWNMFSPNPYTLDVYVEARIHYADGSVRSWEFPRMAKMSYWERYGKERWRKYIEVTENGFNFYWPTMANYAARTHNNRPNDPPIRVDLVRHWRVLPPPGLPTPGWSAYQFYTRPIAKGALR